MTRPTVRGPRSPVSIEVIPPTCRADGDMIGGPTAPPDARIAALEQALATVTRDLDATRVALATAESDIDSLLAGSADAVALVGLDGGVRRRNRKAADILAPGGDGGRRSKAPSAAADTAVRAAVDKVLRTDRSHREEVPIGSRLYLMHVAPHRHGKRLVGAILTLVDVTELRRAQRAALEQAQRTHALIESATDGMIVADRNGLVSACNGAACAILGLGRAEVIGEPAFRLFRNDDGAASLVQHLGGGEIALPGRFEIVLTRAGGTRHLDVVPSAFVLDGNPFRAAVLREITELHETRESLARAKQLAEEANRAKTDFLARMSHELRTPLNAILGFSDVMLSETFGRLPHERYLSYVHDIHTSGQHLLGLISDVFDIARVEAGLLRLRESPIDLVGLVGDCVSSIGPIAGKAGLAVTFDAPTPSVWLKADPLRVRQVLLNLLSNAIKFSYRGGRVQVTLRTLDDRSIAVEVEDRGVGIAASTLETIGTVYVASPSDLARNVEGTGLGLPVSIALMKAHGGHLHIDSTPGVGTTVTLRFGAERALTREQLAGSPAAEAEVESLPRLVGAGIRSSEPRLAAPLQPSAAGREKRPARRQR